MPTAFLSSPIGWVRIEMDEETISSISFTEKKPPLSNLKNNMLQQCHQELIDYFDGKRTTFSLPVQTNGTPFQNSVWQALAAIPYGKTATYQEIATKIGKPRAVRAVGTACKKNPLTIVIPCHRVTSSHGMGGYNGGIERKQWLLQHEKNT